MVNFPSVIALYFAAAAFLAQAARTNSEGSPNLSETRNSDPSDPLTFGEAPAPACAAVRQKFVVALTEASERLNAVVGPNPPNDCAACQTISKAARIFEDSSEKLKALVDEETTDTDKQVIKDVNQNMNAVFSLDQNDEIAQNSSKAVSPINNNFLSLEYIGGCNLWKAAGVLPMAPGPVILGPGQL